MHKKTLFLAALFGSLSLSIHHLNAAEAEALNKDSLLEQTVAAHSTPPARTDQSSKMAPLREQDEDDELYADLLPQEMRKSEAAAIVFFNAHKTNPPRPINLPNFVTQAPAKIPVLFAAIGTKYFTFAKTLLAAGADIDERSEGDTILHCLCKTIPADIEKLEKVLTFGANPELTNAAGKKPYQLLSARFSKSVTFTSESQRLIETAHLHNTLFPLFYYVFASPFIHSQDDTFHDQLAHRLASLPFFPNLSSKFYSAEDMFIMGSGVAEKCEEYTWGQAAQWVTDLAKP